MLRPHAWRLAAAARLRGSSGVVPTIQRTCSNEAAASTVNLGITSAAITDVSRGDLIKAMMHHIDMPHRFLPVSNVSVRAALGDAGEDGALWRSMKFDGSIVKQHIYVNPSAGEIRYVKLADGDHDAELDTEIVHSLRKVDGAFAIECFQRHRDTMERIPWSASRAITARAIEATITLARAAARAADDPTSFAEKA